MSRDLARITFKNWSITLRLYEDGRYPLRWSFGFRRLSFGGNAPWWKQRWAVDAWRFTILFEYYS